MPKTPTTVDEKPSSELIWSASGVNEVTAVRSTSADMAIAAKTSTRPARSGCGPRGAVAMDPAERELPAGAVMYCLVP
ncbi:hypothetical protein RE9431_33580 [Prescottella equi]|nr:hypothetical protein RE9414_33760 [Prescottella equi]BCN50049.1 hypothetical protein RE9416_33500 [Prescottella equi]BCN59988.1 hypothetical protein RE9427_33580 [Prescottella equi]BCN64903.1 hypothetical protein RE9431_33580 [Prescottella equi]BCN69828.1 hypothetical protein RE943_33010 [Prescottella equi]